MIILITYDLNNPGKDYMPLYSAIKDISGTWWHSLTSVWLIDTDKNTNRVRDMLTPRIDSNDELFVVRLTPDYAGYLSREAWQWLNNRKF
ncbi:MAG: hypothetical protein HYX20_00040 [Candidatus Yanofskybacteria bacterium]|nr:hypothetical protein [Candidatus Yanofskybacteria bacterium]